MPRMTAARAAVEILKREGVTNAFGVPGAAINPFYAALKGAGGIDHTLARHVEGASHMAEGYTPTSFASTALGSASRPTSYGG
ncbi:thiamine pyrophosphate-binding protein, partial [Streptomyces decoyicus]|uniref:thiamine pyrophosphate-binding protein n=1 Tax=Streptomyces decoyicus TaxID=249567 RepID=UPI0033A8C21E